MNTKKIVAILVAFALALAGAAFAMEDMKSNVLVKNSIPPVTVSNNDNTTGAVIDTSGYGSLTYVIHSATLADSDITLTPTIQECAVDNCSDASTVAAGQLIGTVAGATFAATDDNTVKTIGYKGYKRYSRIVMTPANNTGAALFGVEAILGHPKYRPE